jgi:hypothetical protein
MTFSQLPIGESFAWSIGGPPATKSTRNTWTDEYGEVHQCPEKAAARAVYPTLHEYQPKTGAKCGCKRGVQRDNCPNCEGTWLVIDFRAIRNRHVVAG